MHQGIPGLESHAQLISLVTQYFQHAAIAVHGSALHFPLPGSQPRAIDRQCQQLLLGPQIREVGCNQYPARGHAHVIVRGLQVHERKTCFAIGGTDVDFTLETTALLHRERELLERFGVCTTALQQDAKALADGLF